MDYWYLLVVLVLIDKMGKTKTAFVSGLSEEKKTSAEEYREKREKKVREAASAKAPTAKKVHIAGLKGGQRIKMVDAAVAEEVKEAPAQETSRAVKTVQGPRLRGKKYQAVKKKVEAGKKYPAKDAIRLVKEISYSTFDGTVEVHLVVKKTGLSVQANLPFPTGKQKRIEIADRKTLEKLKEGKIDFDILLATAEMMPKLVPFARILGPKGLMPNPKNGTLIKDAKAAKNFSTGSLTLKTEKKAPLVHTVIGKVSQKDAELLANLEAIIKAVGEKQILRAFLKSTLSPSIRLQI